MKAQLMKMLKRELDILLGIRLGILYISEYCVFLLSWAYLFDRGNLAILVLRFLGELCFFDVVLSIYRGILRHVLLLSIMQNECKWLVYRGVMRNNMYIWSMKACVWR